MTGSVLVGGSGAQVASHCIDQSQHDYEPLMSGKCKFYCVLKERLTSRARAGFMPWYRALLSAIHKAAFTCIQRGFVGVVEKGTKMSRG